MLTGCDTVSYLYDIDRLQELQHLAKYGNHNESLNVQEYVLSSDYYILSPYDGNDFEGNFDALRTLFGDIKGHARFAINRRCISVAPTTCPASVGYMKKYTIESPKQLI